MKPSGIGGQAVMEGVMMKNRDAYAIAVRKPDKDIEVKVEQVTSSETMKKLRKIPLIRGVFVFIDSLVIGTQAITFSASFFEDEEEENGAEEVKVEETVAEEVKVEETMTEEVKVEETVTEEIKVDEKSDEKSEGALSGWILGLTVFFSIIISVLVFFMLPLGLTELVRKFVTKNDLIIAIIEGVLRILIFMAYIVGISVMDDIKRFYMYHGAEHKCINCVENGWDLTVENARKATRFHKRCGTSFLLIVMIVSIVFFFFIRLDNVALRFLSRIVLIPVIAGISYEFIRLAGSTENKIVGLLSKPGLFLQNLTTREPDDEMLEVAIKSVEAVFDWKDFLDGGSGELRNEH